MLLLVQPEVSECLWAWSCAAIIPTEGQLQTIVEYTVAHLAMSRLCQFHSERIASIDEFAIEATASVRRQLEASSSGWINVD